MIKVTFLGTSGSTPTKSRNLPSVALEYNGGLYLFDCGEGTQRQIMRYSLNISKIKAIFVSHIHGDHVIGIAGLIRTMALNRRQEPLYIYVPSGYEGAIKQLIVFDKAIISFNIIIMPIESGTIYKGDGFYVKAFKLSHSVLTYGFIFVENDKQRFIVQKATELGLKGKMFSELQLKKNIKLNGSNIKLSDVTYTEKGLKVCYITDTRPVTPSKTSLGADLLIHEATFAESEKELAKERWHSTGQDAARVALRIKARKLVLMHFSARYKSTSKIVNEARQIFNDTVAAKDGMSITLDKHMGS
ncbi:MAG: ribonuclease Z [Candidatus Micrarchaeia archaeon]